jgi:hypothetical protein
VDVSREIGRIGPKLDGTALHFILASVGGVELFSESATVLDPCDARTMAVLLVRAADEAERMYYKQSATAHIGPPLDTARFR